MEKNEVVTRTTKIRLGADRIIYATSLPGSVQTLADAQENMRVTNQLVMGRPYVMFVDIREIRSQDRDAREHYTQTSTSPTLRAVALLIGSPMSKVIGNFMIGFSKPEIPTRLFSSEAEAIAWLKEFL